MFSFLTGYDAASKPGVKVLEPRATETVSEAGVSTIAFKPKEHAKQAAHEPWCQTNYECNCGVGDEE